MAHPCPDCGQACFCGGDTDYVLIDSEDEMMACIHCFCLSEDSQEDDYDDFYDEV
jgi:hypothetical protein